MFLTYTLRTEILLFLNNFNIRRFRPNDSLSLLILLPEKNLLTNIIYVTLDIQTYFYLTSRLIQTTAKFKLRSVLALMIFIIYVKGRY